MKHTYLHVITKSQRHVYTESVTEQPRLEL